MKSDCCSWKWGPVTNIPFPAPSHTEPLFMPAPSTWDTTSYLSTYLGLDLLLRPLPPTLPTEGTLPHFVLSLRTPQP